jgi:hypothetical protein
LKSLHDENSIASPTNEEEIRQMHALNDLEHKCTDNGKTVNEVLDQESARVFEAPIRGEASGATDSSGAEINGSLVIVC